MELQSGLILTGCCVDIGGILVQRDDGCVSAEDVSKSVETSVQVGSSGIEILDGIIENLSKESDEPRFDSLVKRCIGEVVTVSHLDVAFEKGLDRAV